MLRCEEGRLLFYHKEKNRVCWFRDGVLRSERGTTQAPWFVTVGALVNAKLV
jgi:hypothetical protein